MTTRTLPEGGYCLSGCRVGFATEQEADGHTALTGHATGYPLKDVDWPLAQDATADVSGSEPCPMGCGRATEDVYGGPCSACWGAT